MACDGEFERLEGKVGICYMKRKEGACWAEGRASAKDGRKEGRKGKPGPGSGTRLQVLPPPSMGQLRSVLNRRRK